MLKVEAPIVWVGGRGTLEDAAVLVVLLEDNDCVWVPLSGLATKPV